MTRRVFKSEIFLSAVGAARVGVTAIAGLTGTTVQDFLSSLKSQVDTRIFGARLNGGSVATFREYLNVVSGQASFADNAALDSLDVILADEVYVGPSAPTTPHKYKLWANTSTTPPLLYRWIAASSTWERFKQALVFRGTWAAGVSYQADDLVSYNGSGYVVQAAHTSSSGSPPVDDNSNPNYGLLVHVGAPGTATLTGHAATHVEGSSDAIANATTGVGGLLSAIDKTKLDSLTTDHGSLGGLGDDDHTIYALASGNRLVVATSPTNLVTNQIRMQGSGLERYTGSAWDSVEARPLDGSVVLSKLASGIAIPKTNLAPLNITTTDMATASIVPIVVTSSTRPTTGVKEGQQIYESDTDNTLVNISSDPASPSWAHIGPDPASFVPAWVNQSGAGACFALYNDGDVVRAAEWHGQGRGVSITTNGTAALKTTAARMMSFRIPKTLTLSQLLVYVEADPAAVTYVFTIYDRTTLAKIGQTVAARPTPANSWFAYSMTGTLVANTDYLLGISTSQASSNNYVHFTGPPGPTGASLGGASAPWAGKGLGVTNYYSITLTAINTWPTNLVSPNPTLANPIYANLAVGSLPIVYGIGNAS